MESRASRFCFNCIMRRFQPSAVPCSRCGKQWALPRNAEHFSTRLTRWLLRPLGWFTHTMTIVVAMILLWGSTTHGPSNLSFIIYIALACLVIIVIWLGRALVRFIVAAFFRRGGWAYSGWRNWLVAPIAALLVTFLIRHDVPMRVAFFISRPAMTRLAQSVLKLPPKVMPPNDVRVGRYRATDIQRLHGGVCFRVADNSFMDGDYFGFAYFPKWKPPARNPKSLVNTSYTHLNGNWYWFRYYDSW